MSTGVSAGGLDALRRDGQRLMEDLSREQYQAYAGLKPTADLQAIYDRHPRLADRETLEMALDAFRGAPPASEELRATRSLLDWLAGTRVQRELAPLDEREIAWEASAMVPLDEGRRMPYQRLAIEIANATDRDERLAMERARAALVDRELAPLRRERFQRERDLVESLDLASGYLDAFHLLSGVDVRALAEECRAFLRDSQAMWDDSVREVVRRKLRIPLEEARRSDVLAVLRAPEFDPQFPSASLQSSVRRQMLEMGIDAEAGGRILYDTGDREGKRSRAFCAPVRVPEEVYLVLRPHGGQTDYRTFLHELGHALHFANTRADYPFEYRWLGDNSVTESYAMLLDHLLHDSGWLLRYTAMTRSELPAFRRSVGFEELHFLRRYCAKLIYEVALYGGEAPWGSLPDLYVDTLTTATNFRYDGADAFVDVDPGFYAARYLRAWQLQAVVRESLVERFDEDWYRNPRAGPWVVEHLFAEGQRELADELALRVAGRPLGFALLIRATESLLSAG